MVDAKENEMSNKPKTIEVSNVKYAMSAELGENHTFLERLAEAGKIGKLVWNGNNYYEVEAAKKFSKELRTIPTGYVRASDHAILLGSDSRTASKLCGQPRAPAKKVIVNGTKPAWFVEKTWFEKQLGFEPATAKTETKTKTVSPPPVAVTKIDTPTDVTIKELQATVADLRTAINNLMRGRQTPETEEITEDVAREQGYRPLQEMAQELEVSSSTLLGWKNRGHVRHYKVSGRLFLNVEDTERMYLKLDENRAVIARKMGERTNNTLRTHPTNGVHS